MYYFIKNQKIVKSSIKPFKVQVLNRNSGENYSWYLGSFSNEHYIEEVQVNELSDNQINIIKSGQLVQIL